MRTLSAFLTTVAALGVMLASGGNASASGEWLGCRIAPGYEFNFYPTCNTAAAPDSNGEYGVAFVVQNQTTAATYSWTTSGYPIATGCTSTTNWCTVSAGTGQQIDVSVTLTQGANVQTLSSTAYTPSIVCNPYCP